MGYKVVKRAKLRHDLMLELSGRIFKIINIVKDEI